jgi:hypothetical protein
MAELVRVASVEKIEELKTYLEELFKRGRYAEMTQAIGMHSLLIDPQHTLKDQAGLYHFVLGLIKDRLRKAKGDAYSAWYAHFPELLDRIITANRIVTDKAAADVIASHRAAYGPFKSLDDFFFWALDDRREQLDEIMKYIEATAAETTS